jgi:hypothetical protein
MAGKLKQFQWFYEGFWFKTIEFGDINIKSVDDFKIKFGQSKISLINFKILWCFIEFLWQTNKLFDE